MQSIVILTVICLSTVFGDISLNLPSSGSQPQRALLILPPQSTTPKINDSPQSVQNETENIIKLNDNVMERLRQETGSDTGVYYVYLPDGRLQKIQYTTAPVKQQETQQQTTDYNTNQQQFNQYKQNTNNGVPQGTQQSNSQVVFGLNKNSNQGNQQQQQYNQYTAQQQTGESRFQEFAQYQPFAQQSTGNSKTEEGNPNQLLAQYNQDKAQNSVPATSYLASVQFTDVPPISGPIFAYSPSPLVRIVRYADNYRY